MELRSGKLFSYLTKKRTAEQEEQKQKKKKYDPEFLAAIQPQGGISFQDKFVKKETDTKRVFRFMTIRQE